MIVKEFIQKILKLDQEREIWLYDFPYYIQEPEVHVVEKHEEEYSDVGNHDKPETRVKKGDYHIGW